MQNKLCFQRLHYGSVGSQRVDIRCLLSLQRKQSADCLGFHMLDNLTPEPITNLVGRGCRGHVTKTRN